MAAATRLRSLCSASKVASSLSIFSTRRRSDVTSSVNCAAEPQEIADAVVLLASPRSGSTTGTEFVVDCGWIKGS